MASRINDLRRQMELRKRAVSKLTVDSVDAEAQLTAATAFNVLHTLASSPTTAGDALAVLHELQVHQVELDLQHEEMQRSGLELEAGLIRQIQLYDHAPVALLSLDANARMVELNLAAARLLAQDRNALVGLSLLDFLAAESRATLSALLERVRTFSGSPTQALKLETRSDPPVVVRATVAVDPAGSGFLVALSAGCED